MGKKSQSNRKRAIQSFRSLTPGFRSSKTAVLRVLSCAFITATLAAQQVSFRITPVRPVPELRAEALKASPPREQGTFRKAELVELVKLDPTIKLDIRYAGTNNFLGT